MDGTSLERDKPWRPADHPRPAPSWDEAAQDPLEHRGQPDAED
jgi:hypothetical protein